MKQKYLLGMLLGGAMLTACNVEDDFNLAPVAQESSAPVFNVSLYDDADSQTRAKWSDDGWKVKFEATDLLSLYHGMAKVDDGKWQNAIYQGTAADGVDGGAFTFTTKSMVTPGHAIMIYPADTSLNGVGENALGTTAPKVTIDQHQDGDYKKKTPYMSAVLNIGREDNTTTALGGYGKDYDIVLRRVAGILEMTLNSKNVELVDGVDLKIKKVELNDANAIFTTEVQVKENTGTYSSHKKWAAKSDLDFTKATGKTSITTTDLKDALITKNQASVATFTLLPKPTTVTQSTNSNLVVYTTYGKVVVGATEEAWGSNGKTNTQNAIATIVGDNAMYKTTSGGTFSGEKMGQRAGASVNIDMKNLSMDNMHIANNDELDAALTVYEKIGKDFEKNGTGNITWILDGTNKTFTMEQAVWKRLETQLNKSGNKIQIALCNDEAECNTVVLKGTNAEVPALKFVTVNGTAASIAMNLNGSWTYSSSEDNASTSADERKGLTGVGTLTVLSGSTLTLKKYITAQNTTMKIVNNGTTETDGDVTLELNMDNHGTLNIPAGTSLSLKDEATAKTGVTLENCAIAQDNKNSKTGKSNFDEGGVINVSNLLAINQNLSGESQSKINNYGTIKQLVETAYILITNNKKDNAEINSAYTNNNQIGTIELKNAKGSVNVNVKNIIANKGFIKINVETTNEVAANFGDLANYVVVGGSCAGVKYAEDAKGVATNLPKQVEYIEIENGGTEVLLDGDFTKLTDLKGLFVNENKNARITSGSTVKLSKAVYAKGLIIFSGTFGYPYTQTNNDYCSYFGGTIADVDNIKSFGGTSVSTSTGDEAEEEAAE